MADPWVRKVVIGSCELYLGDCLEVMPSLGSVDHFMMDPPYEEITHTAKSKGGARRDMRADGRKELQELDFAPIDEIRGRVVELGTQCDGWFIAFCTPEGVRPWADEINASPMKYKRACTWIKPDSPPQFNGQGPASGFENFVCAWAGKGHSRWNAGGKRGVYTEMVSPKDRTGGHPTEKPWRLMRELLFDFTRPGDLVADPFAGSGTTLVAAALTGRRAIGIEQNPEYFSLACRRVRKAVLSVQQLGADLLPCVQGDMFQEVEAYG
ncbi:site-specific DNA-methyltransferase [Leisingera daeponensis]|uniref:Methyltransferase n=1 Tax=Leisingera daeponensis TaxID=405746 RepID=A0ABS7NBG6_9RHOB|nr:site-specific DNA-methyltransferase [Leisingera daeponensis]MBY6138543.1 site-specific DNA-methyltransferase [Leisingera daeponensis]